MHRECTGVKLCILFFALGALYQTKKQECQGIDYCCFLVGKIRYSYFVSWNLLSAQVYTPSDHTVACLRQNVCFVAELTTLFAVIGVCMLEAHHFLSGTPQLRRSI